MACDDRQLTEAQRVAGYQNQRTGVQRAVRPFSGRPTLDNLIDYINRELGPAVRQTRDAVNDVYLQVADNAPSGNPLAFYFSTDTTNADPTAGRIRFDASPQNTATTVRVSETNARLVSVVPWFDVMAGSSTTPLGVITVSDAINPSRYVRFDLNTMTDQGTYWDLGVAVIESSHSDPFVEDEAIVVAFIPGVAAAGTTVPPSALTPIAAQSVLGNPTSSTAAPVAIELNDLSVLGRAGVLGTDVAGIDVPDASVFTGESVFLRVASTRLGIQWRPWTLVDMPLMSDNHFVANITGATARPVYTDLGDLSSNSIIYENPGKTFIREALFGDVVAAQNDNETVIQSNVVTDTKLRDSGPLSVIGRSVNSTGDPADISAVAASGAVLRESGSTIGWGTVANAGLADMAASRIKGRAEGASTGAPQDLTPTQVAAIIDNEAITWTALQSFNGAIALSGPTQIVSPSGVTDVTLNAGTSHVLLSSTADFSLNSISGAGTTGRLLVVEHSRSSGTGFGTVVHASGTAPASSAIATPEAVNFDLGDRHAMLLIARFGAWRVIARAASGYGITDGDKGDITVSSRGLTFTVDANAITDAKLRQSAGLSVIGRSANSTGNVADITAANDAEVLRRAGTTLGFGTVATAGIADDAVTDAKLRNSGALSVIGRSANSSGDPADISAVAASDAVLRESGSVLGFGTVATGGITNNAVTNAKLAQMAASTVKGRAVGAGTGDPQDLTAAQVRAIVDSAPIAEVEETGAGPFNDYAPATAGARHIMCSNAAGVFTGLSATNYVVGDWVIFSHQGTGYTEFQHNTGSGVGNVFFTGRQGRNLRIFDNEIAVFRYVDTASGASTVTRWELQSPLFPFAQSSADAAGDVIAHNGTNYVAVSGGNSADVVLRGNATFGTVSNTALANMTAGTVKGRQIDAGTGAPVDLTGLEVAELIRFGTVQSATIAATTNDFSVNADATVLRLTSTTGSQTITGFTGGAAGRLLVIENVSADGNPIVLTSLDVGSAVGNRIRTPRNQPLTIGFREDVVLLYSGASIDWRVAAMGTTPLVDGDKGDITVSSTATVWTIDNDVVTDAKLRNSAALSVIGRSANSTGDPADITGTASSDAVLRISGTTLGFGTVATAGIANDAVTDAKLRNSAALSVIGRSANSTGDPADIAAANDGEVLRRSGTALGFGQVATAGIADGAVNNAKLRNSAALSVIGNSTNAVAVPNDIAAVSDAHVLRRSGTTLGFGQVATDGIANTAVTLGKMENRAQSTFIGRQSGAGTGSPQELTAAQAVTIIGGSNPTWPGSHTFSGAAFTVLTSADVAIGSGGTTTLSGSTRVETTSPLRVANAIGFDNVLTTATTAANDLAIGTANVVRFTGPVDPLTGMVATATGQVVLLINVSATTNMGIHLNSVNSSAANQFTGTGTSRVIRPGEMGLAWYDGTSSRWRLLLRDEIDL